MLARTVARSARAQNKLVRSVHVETKTGVGMPLPRGLNIDTIWWQKYVPVHGQITEHLAPSHQKIISTMFTSIPKNLDFNRFNSSFALFVVLPSYVAISYILGGGDAREIAQWD